MESQSDTQPKSGPPGDLLHALVRQYCPRFVCFLAPKTHTGRAWWFWRPRVFLWRGNICGLGWRNAPLLRVAWFNFAVSVKIGEDYFLPNDQISRREADSTTKGTHE